MVALLAVQVVALVHAQAVRNPPPLPSVCFEKPAPTQVPARIEGQIVSRDGRPVTNVEVKAEVGPARREYTTVSDAQGRYVLSGFDTGADVLLVFRDFARDALVACSVQPTIAEPVVSLRVSIGNSQRASGSGDLGCFRTRDNRLLPSTIGAADITFMRRAPEPQPDEHGLPTLALHSSDIAEVVMLQDAAALRLTPAGTEALASFTAANVGRLTLTTIDGEPALRVWIQGAIDSGGMSIPDTFLRGKPLCRKLGALARPPP